MIRIITSAWALVLVAGVVFMLQGLRLLPSRVMYGETVWVAIGGVMAIAAVLALVFLRHRR